MDKIFLQLLIIIIMQFKYLNKILDKMEMNKNAGWVYERKNRGEPLKIILQWPNRGPGL